MTQILGLIPARGGSKGIPNKNAVLLVGQPLLWYTAQAALEAKSLSRVLLSTDDQKIAELGKQYGLEVPFLRPKELAEDTTSMIDVLFHALSTIADTGDAEPEILILLQPTSPLRMASDIDAAVELLVKTGADTVVSVTEVPHHFGPQSMMRLEGDKLRPFLETPPVLLRQGKERVYARNGPAILAIRTAFLKQKKGFYAGDTRAYVMPRERSIDIDDAFDLKVAEGLMLG